MFPQWSQAIVTTTFQCCSRTTQLRVAADGKTVFLGSPSFWGHKFVIRHHGCKVKVGFWSAVPTDLLVGGVPAANLGAVPPHLLQAGGRPGLAPVSVPVSVPGSASPVVERQVLVARCKYCQGITPMDLENCEKCGAPKFC